MKKVICRLLAFGLFLWCFMRNTLDVQEVMIIFGAIGWILMGENE